MFIPLSDQNSLKYIDVHYVTLGLIAANVLIFGVFQSGILFPEAVHFAIATGLGVVPGELLDNLPARGPIGIPESATLVSYMFLHGGWMHLIGNMLFLWVFGDNVEDALGHWRFLIFYLACGIFAGLAHAWISPTSNIPLVGASGAVAGIVAAYLMLHPNVRIWILLLGRLPLKLSAFWVLGGWIVFQFYNVLVAIDDVVAWWAHIGGLVAGAVLIVIMRRPGVPLFDRDVS